MARKFSRRTFVIAVFIAAAALPLFADSSALTISGYGDDERVGGTITYHFIVSHTAASQAAATFPSVEIHNYDQMQLYSFSDNVHCTTDAPDVRCPLPTIPLGQSVAFDVTFSGGPAQASLDIEAAVRWGTTGSNDTTYITTTVYRPIDVTTEEDFVPGSLRAAIDDVNAGPCPCRIAFRIPPPVPARGWFVIAPIAPLPHINARTVLIDGNRQTELTGDTNPRGPEIEITGVGTFADGLIFEDTVLGYYRHGGEVRGLAVNGFATGGIVADSGYEALYVHDCYIGTDPTGEVAVPNLRGVWTRSGGAWLRIEHNVVSGNVRSGVYALSHADVRLNRIGVSASGAPLGNGASGIFAAFDGTIEGNVIAHNRDFAIGTPKPGYWAAPLVGENSMFDNGGPSYDIGMDGPSRNVPFAFAGNPAAETPDVVSATFDGTNTVIQLHDDEASDPNGNFNYGYFASLVTLYVFETPQLNRAGYAEGEHFLGKVVVDGYDATFTVPGDLRGHYITALAQRFVVSGEFEGTTSSELSLGTLVR